MKPKHTPKPWLILPQRDHILIIADNDKVVCRINKVDPIDDEANANADLITEAPELLEACVLVSKCNRTEHLPVNVVIKLMEAIEKVTV